MSIRAAATDRLSVASARAAIARGDFQRADALFRQLVDGEPGDAEVLAEYGIFCLRSSRAASADWLLAKAASLHPGQAGWLAQRGYALLELGCIEAANGSFEAALAIHPGEPSARYGLALCHQHAGAWPQAAAAFAAALATATAGDAYPILFHLAQACARAGDAKSAATYYEQAAQGAPNDPGLLLAWARFLREHGEPARALALLERAMAADPREPRLLLEQARCLHARGDTARALRLLEQAQQAAPEQADVREAQGECRAGAARAAHWLAAIQIRIDRGQCDAARSLLDRLLEQFPASAAGWNLRGLLEEQRHRLDAAEAAWRKAIALDPSHLPAIAHLALLHEASNRLDEAERVAQAAAAHLPSGECPPAAVEIQLALARLARRRKDDATTRLHLDRIQALASNAQQRMHAAFERGKWRDAQGDADGAMAAFGEGNRLALDAWQRVHPGRNKALAGVEYMLDFVGKGGLQAWRPILGLTEHLPIAFLIGFPRSGTTLLNQVLDGHPAIRTIEEKPTVQAILDGVQAMPGGYPHALARLDGFDIDWLRAAYDRVVAQHGGGAAPGLLLDKFPMNTLLAGMLHRVFPQARFVFALRHPCDVVLSCFMQSFTLNNTMTNFCTLADTVALYTRTMDLWQFYREQLPLNVHTIRYEDVVDDFDGQVRALCGFLGVEWRGELRDFSSKARERGKINTPSYEQVVRPIYRESRYRWERYREFLEPCLPALAPYIERFGYAPIAARADG
ncbi:MAG: sulfotransferase [Proteobacteria bacterium]|nr:sulfotransferase [Pseudomonadota bacterium]